MPDDKEQRHLPEIEAAEQPLTDAFLACVRALSAGGAAPSEDDLALSLEATAQGYVMLLLGGGAGQGREAAERAARATLALIESRHLLGQPSSLPAPEASSNLTSPTSSGTWAGSGSCPPGQGRPRVRAARADGAADQRCRGDVAVVHRGCVVLLR